MYFKKLEISGFKSFAEKTVLHFEPGITAIVGPNGCGKSNIFDSMRWCLGEQSIKSLRGSKSEDVIFNGTETTPAKNMAEVSLTISNEAKILPIDYDEVTITRRLFRSGESEYCINNNPVRLKDINEMLMGTGIGAESYSLVEQGKIDLVISSKPEDRRLVFDEATGVSKYKAKKKEAAKKLEETDNNLLRINDIIVEVKRQIGSIERQASKARRYKEIFDRLKEMELKLSSFELKNLKAELSMLTEMARSSQLEEVGLNTQLQALDNRLISQQRELQELDNKLSELKGEISEHENIVIRNRQHINLDQDRLIDLGKHIDILTNQKNQLKLKIDSHQKNISELSGQLASHHDVFSRKETDCRSKEEGLQGLVATIEACQNENKDAKQKIFDLNFEETRTSNLLNESASNIHTYIARQRRLQTEKIKTEEENSELLSTLQQVDTEISTERQRIQDVTNRCDAVRSKKAALEDTLKQMEGDLRHLENEKLGLKSQAEFLKELRLKYDSMPEAKYGVFEIQQIPEGKITGIIAHAREVVYQETTKTYRVTCELKFISFDLDLLEARINDMAGQIEQMIRTMQEKEHELMAVVNELKIAEEELQQEKFNLTNKEAVQTNLCDNARKIQDELSVIRLELDEVNENLTKTQAAEKTQKEALEATKNQIVLLESLINDNHNKVNAAISSRENILVEIAQLKTELANQQAQQDALQSNLNFFQEGLAQDTNTWNLSQQEIATCEQKTQELTAEIAALESEIQAQEAQTEAKTKEHRSLSQVRIEEVNSLDFVQKQIIDVEEKIDKVKEDNHRYQMQEQELNFKHANIKTRILQTFNVDLDETPVTLDETQPLDVASLTADITALREKVEGFGTVNLVAIEELEELKNRFDFLTQQQSDLLMAKDSLQKAILKINRNTRKMFLETFQMVAEEFKNYFRLLFGGGEARLFLLDEEDVLESGIEIICRPPGKKLQNITLLSGGEKSLSAIALIFAIFKTKPSPFCVLDEIDAALDESNIDRFSRMLGDFAKTSQFITITHNKKTISRAHVMYGITMEHSGISKIVSVKLHENAHLKAEAQATPAVQIQEEPISEEPLSSEPAAPAN